MIKELVVLAILDRKLRDELGMLSTLIKVN